LSGYRSLEPDALAIGPLADIVKLTRFYVFHLGGNVGARDQIGAGLSARFILMQWALNWGTRQPSNAVYAPSLDATVTSY
jgi:hypothetical protein